MTTTNSTPTSKAHRDAIATVAAEAACQALARTTGATGAMDSPDRASLAIAGAISGVAAYAVALTGGAGTPAEMEAALKVIEKAARDMAAIAAADATSTGAAA